MVLRYVVSGLSGMKREESVLLPYASNRERVAKAAGRLPGGWAQGGANPGLTRDLLARVRERKSGDACDLALNQLVEGKATAGAVWDAVHLAGGEMIMCTQKNSTPLHANTVANALHYAFEVSSEPANRLLLVLQALGWMIHFRESVASAGWLQDARDITTLVDAPIPDQPEKAAGEILAHASFGPGGQPTPDPVPGWHGLQYNNQPWRYRLASQAFAFAKRYPRQSHVLFREASRLIPAKADGDPHRVKFPVAAFENHRWVSPEWRPHMLAAASYSFLGRDAVDAPLMQQVREAVRGL